MAGLRIEPGDIEDRLLLPKAGKLDVNWPVNERNMFQFLTGHWIEYMQ
jgi:hypothetical protein